jgi:putative ubiquitin-RnfH superfamily antitoxin RatB of RatAB toxin-antitoxin module
MADDPMIPVEVAYALHDEQVIIPLQVKAGTTLEQAIVQSGILERFPQIQLENDNVGIFGHAQPRDKVLSAKDRVEIYRPILCDPKEVRRQRGKKKSSKASADTEE